MAQTKTQMAEAIAQRDMAHGACRRLAEMVMGGCDYDEMAQRLTDTYAEWLGISEDDYEAYDLVNEIANEHLTAEIGTDTDEAEEGWREKIRSEEGYDEADEDMSTEDVREWAQDWCDTMGTDIWDRLFERVTEEMVAWAGR